MPTMRWTFALLLLLLAACGGNAAPSSTSTSAPTHAAQPAATSVAPAPSGALPQGRTPEGYHVLGRSDAPVTLTFYSDFF